MQDTIIKGTGNSRSLRSVPNFLKLYPSYEAFAQALVAGTLPIDLGALNPAGLEVQGTDLSKANLLSDVTAALYGKTASAVPNEIFAETANRILALNTSQIKAETGSYVGTDGVKTINFNFIPKFFICLSNNVNVPGVGTDSTAAGITGVYSGGNVTGSYAYRVSSASGIRWNLNFGGRNENSLSLSRELNMPNVTYHYFAIG